MSWIARVYNWVTDRNNGVPITASRMDGEFDNIITGLNNCITADGTNAPTANIAWGSKKITSLATPTASTDAATKGYVDGFIKADGTVPATANIPFGGFKLTGLGTPTASTDAATKGYVDTAVTHVIAHTDTANAGITAAGGIQKFALDLEVVDTLGEFTPSTTVPAFTVSVTGLYYVDGFVAVTPSATSVVSLYIYNNAAIYKKFTYSGLTAGSVYTLGYHGLISLTAADVLTFLIETDNDLTSLNPDPAGANTPLHVNGLSIFRVK